MGRRRQGLGGARRDGQDRQGRTGRDLGGYRQIAIEPATGGADRPHLAVPPPLLEPNEELRWWLEVRDSR